MKTDAASSVKLQLKKSQSTSFISKETVIFKAISLSPLFYLNYLKYYNILTARIPRGLRRRSAAARLLRSWVRILPGAWIFVCCECCVLSGRGLCDEVITRPEESYQLWCVVVCDLETSRIRRS